MRSPCLGQSREQACFQLIITELVETLIGGDRRPWRRRESDRRDDRRLGHIELPQQKSGEGADVRVVECQGRGQFAPCAHFQATPQLDGHQRIHAHLEKTGIEIDAIEARRTQHCRDLATNKLHQHLVPRDGGDSEQVLVSYARAGIDVPALARQLQEDGAKSFVASWKELLGAIDAKSKALT